MFPIPGALPDGNLEYTPGLGDKPVVPITSVGGVAMKPTPALSKGESLPPIQFENERAVCPYSPSQLVVMWSLISDGERPLPVLP